MFTKNKKAQGALEYLLIIGGAMLIAVIAIVIITGLGRSNTETVGENQEGYQQLVDNQIVTPIISDIECLDATNNIVVYTAGSPTTGVSGYMISLDGNAFVGFTTTEPDQRRMTLQKAISAGEKYSIRLIALKNNLRSTPTLSFDCIVK